MSDVDRLKSKVQQEIGRMHSAADDRSPWLAYTRYLGTLALLIVAPIVGGAYLGVWLDHKFDTYGWTPALIVAGVAVGVLDVYLFMKRMP